MLYCEKCSALYEDDAACPFCHKHQGRAPKADDLCYLTDQGSVWCDVLLDVFHQQGIPCMRKLSVGVAPFVGSNLARYRVYTPYARMDEARQALCELLTPVDEDDNEEDAGE